MRRLAALLLVASCAADVDGTPEAFTEPCVVHGGVFGTSWPWASHDFGTTGPAELARVTAYDAFADPSSEGGDTGIDVAVRFEGSVGFAPCSGPGDVVTFSLAR